MSKRLLVGATSVFFAVALAMACSSSKSNSKGSGGSGGASGGSGGASGGSGGSGGSKDGGPTDGSGGNPFADVQLDAPYQLPDGGCGQVFCPSAVAAACKNGFQTLKDCSDFCTIVAASKCQTQFNALLTCAGPSPNITCDSTDTIAVTGCSTEQQAFQTCYLSDAGL